MKVNWAERLIVNNSFRVLVQRHLIRWYKQKTLLSPGAKILEVGCGRGAGAALLLKEYAPTLVHALDLDPKMICQARSYLASHLGAIFPYVGDVSRLPYPDASLDAVFAFGVLHHVPDWRQALGEIARVLKPGGRYFLEEFYPTFYQIFPMRQIFKHPEEDRFHRADLDQALETCGFTVADTVEIPKVWVLGVAVKTENGSQD